MRKYTNIINIWICKCFDSLVLWKSDDLYKSLCLCMLTFANGHTRTIHIYIYKSILECGHCKIIWSRNHSCRLYLTVQVFKSGAIDWAKLSASLSSPRSKRVCGCMSDLWVYNWQEYAHNRVHTVYITTNNIRKESRKSFQWHSPSRCRAQSSTVPIIRRSTVATPIATIRSRFSLSVVVPKKKKQKKLELKIWWFGIFESIARVCIRLCMCAGDCVWVCVHARAFVCGCFCHIASFGKTRTRSIHTESVVPRIFFVYVNTDANVCECVRASRISHPIDPLRTHSSIAILQISAVWGHRKAGIGIPQRAYRVSREWKLWQTVANQPSHHQNLHKRCR